MKSEQCRKVTPLCMLVIASLLASMTTTFAYPLSADKTNEYDLQGEETLSNDKYPSHFSAEQKSLDFNNGAEALSNDKDSFPFTAEQKSLASNVGRCDVLFGNQCYILIMSMSRMSLGEAEEKCRGVKGKMANVYSEEHFHLLRALVRSRAPIGFTYNHVWTGMTIDASTRRMKLSNGQWAPYAPWLPSRPFTPARPFVGIHVNVDNKGFGQGVFDEWDSYRLLGGLCEVSTR